jgi:hypothetical protein
LDSYDEIVHVAYDDDDSTGESRPVLASVPLRGELEPEDEGRTDGLVLSLVAEQVAYARSCEGVWEYRYQWCFAVPAVAVLAVAIRIVSHHHSFFGVLAALSAVMILAAFLGLL